jgi:hypothetical protein
MFQLSSAVAVSHQEMEGIMIPVPNAVMSQYSAVLKKRDVDLALFSVYKKWLRYFLDFCSKYSESNIMSEQVRLFLEKLREKKQTEAQCQQAAHAVSLYFELQERVEFISIPNIPCPRVEGVE